MMRSIIFSFALIFIITIQSISPSISIQQEKLHGSYSSKLDYSYVEVFEKGEWWIYVYDGSVLIDRYIMEE